MNIAHYVFVVNVHSTAIIILEKASEGVPADNDNTLRLVVNFGWKLTTKSRWVLISCSKAIKISKEMDVNCTQSLILHCRKVYSLDWHVFHWWFHDYNLSAFHSFQALTDLNITCNWNAIGKDLTKWFYFISLYKTQNIL